MTGKRTYKEPVDVNMRQAGIDVETTSIDPKTGQITSIGVFVSDTKLMYHELIVVDPASYNRVDEGCMQWREENKIAEMEQKYATLRVSDEEHALIMLRNLLCDAQVDFQYVWFNHPEFDLEFLKAANAGYKFPWHHRQVKDVQSYLLGAEFPETLWGEAENLHCALFDASWNVQVIQKAALHKQQKGKFHD